jgi:HlyD family secretion protein
VYFLPDETEGAPEVPERRLFCPADAVMKEGTTNFVWVLREEDRVQRVDVKAGTANDGQVEILEGLSGEERVVVRPPAELRNGLRVKAAE